MTRQAFDRLAIGAKVDTRAGVRGTVVAFGPYSPGFALVALGAYEYIIHHDMIEPFTPAPVSHLDGPGLLARVMRERHGFFLDTDVALLAADPAGRLYPVLVRCGSCRFTCPAQDVAHLEACIVAGGDYVRDVSIIAGAAGAWPSGAAR